MASGSDPAVPWASWATVLLDILERRREKNHERNFKYDSDETMVVGVPVIELTTKGCATEE